MVFTINGTSIVPYIAQSGIKWQRNDIDAPNTGRTLDGKMHRGRITTKIRLDITCRPMTASELQTLMSLILPEYVTVVYDDPAYGRVLKQMYSNNHPASFFFINDKGEEMWTGVTFPLIEV